MDTNLMESKSGSIEYRDPELEKCFSFSSCHDFNSSSSPAIFSDNDDADDDYIEIALEPAHFRHSNGGGGGHECCDGEMELRISFSSCVPLPAIKTTTDLYESSGNSSTSSLSSSSLSSTTFSFRSSSRDSQRNPADESKPMIESKPINRLVNTLISSFSVSSEVDQRNGRSTETSHLELVPSSDSRRKSSKTTTAATMNSSNFMMKFFIKFRALKLRKLLASFLQASQSSNLSIDKCEEPFLTYNRNLTNPMEKGSAEKKQGVLELNLDAIRGVLEAMSITSLGRRDKIRSKSRPVSTKSSPIHQRFLTETCKFSANDNSIQAAIAHCKKSFETSA